MLVAPDADVRAVAAFVLGKIGNPAALGPLRKAAGDERDQAAKYNMTEAMAVLGDAKAYNALEAYATGFFYGGLQLEAISALGREYSPDTMSILQELAADSRSSPLARVKAYGVMARLGQISNVGYNFCVEAARNPGKFSQASASVDRQVAEAELASVQQLSALSLGWMKRPEAVAVLQPLLANGKGIVRVAAAESIFRLLSPGKAEPAASTAAAAAPAAESQPAKDVLPPALHTSGAKD
jgi:HEAT repeat protein